MGRARRALRLRRRPTTKRIKQGSPEWLAARRTGIGGSDVAAILGVSPWKGALEVYAEKCGLVDPREPSESMRWGTLLEPVVRKEYARRTGRRVRPGVTLARHPDDDFLIASTDGEVVREDGVVGVLEIKTASAYAAEDWEEGVPIYYEVQVQHYMHVTGRQWASVAVLIGGQELRWFDLARHDAFIRAYVPRMREFWRCVQEGRAPEATPLGREILDALQPTRESVVINLGDDAMRIVSELEEAKRERREVDGRVRRLETELRERLGVAEFGRLPDGRLVRYANVKRAAYTVPESEYRVLRILKRVPRGIKLIGE